MADTESVKTKTFGIENEIILKNIGLALGFWALTPALIIVFQIFFECYYLVNTTKKSAHYTVIALGHYEGFMCLEVFLCTFLLRPLSFVRIRKYTIWIWGITAIFKVVYLYNPWISNCHKNAYPHLNYFLFFIHTFAPVALCVHVFVTIIYWRMSKEEREHDGEEESYEDI